MIEVQRIAIVSGKTTWVRVKSYDVQCAHHAEAYRSWLAQQNPDHEYRTREV